MAPARKTAKSLKTVKPAQGKLRKKALKRANPDEKNGSPEDVHMNTTGPRTKKRRHGKVDHGTNERDDNVRNGHVLSDIGLSDQDEVLHGKSQSDISGRSDDSGNEDEEVSLAERINPSINKLGPIDKGKQIQLRFAKKFREFTSKSTGDRQKILLYDALRRYAAKDFLKLTVFYKDKMPEVIGQLKRQTSENFLTEHQAMCAAFMRLVDYTMELEENHRWNMLCAIHLRLTWDSRNKSVWSAYEMKQQENDILSIEKNPDLSALPRNEFRDFKKSLMSKFEETSAVLCKEDEEIYYQVFVPDGGEILCIGTLQLKYPKKKHSKGRIIAAYSTAYVINPRMPFIFACGPKIRLDELDRIMRSANPEYKFLHDLELSDVGLTSLQSVCYTPDLENALDFDVIEKEAEEEAENEAARHGTEKFRGVKAELKRSRICKKLLENFGGFVGANNFATKITNDSDDEDVCTVTFRSRSGNVAQMLENVCKAGTDPAAFLEARSKKKAKAAVLANQNLNHTFSD